MCSCLLLLLFSVVYSVLCCCPSFFALCVLLVCLRDLDASASRALVVTGIVVHYADVAVAVLLARLSSLPVLLSLPLVFLYFLCCSSGPWSCCCSSQLTLLPWLMPFVLTYRSVFLLVAVCRVALYFAACVGSCWSVLSRSFAFVVRCVLLVAPCFLRIGCFGSSCWGGCCLSVVGCCLPVTACWFVGRSLCGVLVLVCCLFAVVSIYVFACLARSFVRASVHRSVRVFLCMCRFCLSLWRSFFVCVFLCLPGCLLVRCFLLRSLFSVVVGLVCFGLV